VVSYSDYVIILNGGMVLTLL